MAEVAVAPGYNRLERLESRWALMQQEHARFRRNVAENITKEHVGLMYVVSYLVLIGELAATLVVLPITGGQECDVSLRFWLCGYVVRTALWFPAMLYQQRQVFANNGGAAANDDAISSNTTTRYCAHYRTYLRVASLVWFVLGNALIFTAKSCQDTSPLMYFLSLAWVILGYIGLIAPAVLYLSMMFCFPCLFAFFSRVSAPVTAVSPQQEAAIQALSVKSFQPGLVPEDKANCIICTENYAAGCEVRFLPCDHHFHKQCSDVWLRLKATCPLCVRPIMQPILQREDSLESVGSNVELV